MPTRNRSRAAFWIAVGTVSALTLAGCGSASAQPADPSGASLRIVLGSQPQASQIPLVYGVSRNGGDFGLAISVEQNVTKFDSHTNAVQTLLDGNAQIMATSFSAILDAREQGQDVKMFCPYVSMDDFVLAGANGVNNAGQLFDPSTRVGIDSPGGAGAIVLNALLSGIGEPRDVDEIPNQQIIESSSARTEAWGAGQLDATVIHDTQYDGAEATVDRPVLIATLYENAPGFIKVAQAARADWLVQNRELAARYCATTLRAMRALKSNFAVFQAAVDEYVEPTPSEQSLRELFDLIQKYPFWTDDGGLSDDSVKFMIDIARESGVLTQPMNPADIVDRETLSRAVELANMPTG
ncbi:ABC transporter substrate-binding protein [Mycobacterium sp. 2YAF39]|uniref:ABC transporter substrate-binding protein n=1 Tax=Mycobacterium sp. 2YAF39 TaxID=3233033 RepID=UPI003F98D03E